LGWLGAGPENKTFFFEKRTTKLLRGCRRVVRDSHAIVFASFFKKTRFLAY
jgi:hypothetical protein